MVSASRCNLLSRCLPYYQKGVLSQLDKAADAYHQVLAELRTHHDHQYKVKKIMEEIHHLETEDELEHGIISPEVGLKTSASSLGSSLGSVEGSAGPTTDRDEEDDDEPLIDIGQLAGAGEEGEGQSPGAQEKGDEPSDDAPERKPGEQDLLGDLGDFSQQPPCPSAADELNDLLQLELPMEQADSERSTDQKSPADQLFDEWSTFSAFMPATKPDGEPPTAAGASDWEEEFRQTGPPPEPLLGLELEQLQSQDGGSVGENDGSVVTDKQSAGSSDILAPGAGLLQPTMETSVPSSQPSEAGGLDDLLAVPPSGRRQSDSLENLLTPDDANKPASSTGGGGATALSDDLATLGLASPPATSRNEGATSTGLESLDPALFQHQFSLPASQIGSSAPSMQAPLIPTPDTTAAHQPSTGSSIPLSTHPVSGSAHLVPGPTSLPMFRSPLTASPNPIIPPQPMLGGWGLGGQLGSGAARGSVTGGGVARPGGGAVPREKVSGDKSEKKETAWMNVFAHLDPLVNEKA